MVEITKVCKVIVRYNPSNLKSLIYGSGKNLRVSVDNLAQFLILGFFLM